MKKALGRVDVEELFYFCTRGSSSYKEKCEDLANHFHIFTSSVHRAAEHMSVRLPVLSAPSGRKGEKRRERERGGEREREREREAWETHGGQRCSFMSFSHSSPLFSSPHSSPLLSSSIRYGRSVISTHPTQHVRVRVTPPSQQFDPTPTIFTTSPPSPGSPTSPE